jgi:hypothetical protein
MRPFSPASRKPRGIVSIPQVKAWSSTVTGPVSLEGGSHARTVSNLEYFLHTMAGLVPVIQPVKNDSFAARTHVDWMAGPESGHGV